MALVFDPRTGLTTEVDMGDGGMPPPAPAAPQQSGMLRRLVGDPLVTATKAVVGVPEMLVGLANIPTMGQAGKALESVGVRFKDTQQILSDLYSTQQQAAEKKVQGAEGFLGTAGAMLSEPVYTLHKAAEMVPQIFAGGAVGRAVTGGAKAAEAAAAAGQGVQHAMKAAAIGEGITAAGANTEQLRQQTEDGTLTPGQVATQVAAGVTTGLIGFGAGKLATKMGITDLDVLAAGGNTGARTLREMSTMGRAGAVARGAFQEGVMEEMPQSSQEQMWNNVALSRPLLEGVPEAAGMGVVLGGVMGGTVAGRMQNNKVADAAAAVQILATPPADGDTKQHELALKAVGDLVSHFDPSRRTDMAAWRAEQLARVARGEEVDYTAVPEFAPDSTLRAGVQSILSAMEQRRAGTSQDVVDDFGNVVNTIQGELPRPFTPEQRRQYNEMRAALASDDPLAIARVTGRMPVPAFTPAQAIVEEQEAAPPAVIPPASAQNRSGSATSNPPTLKAMESWTPAALQAYIQQQEASAAPDTKGIEAATKVLLKRAGEPPAPPSAATVVKAVATDMKKFTMRGGRRADAETFAGHLAKGDVAAAEAFVRARDEKFDPAGKVSDAEAAFIESLNRQLPKPLTLNLGGTHATQPAAQNQAGTESQPAAPAADAQAAGVNIQAATEGNAAAQPAQEGEKVNAVQEPSAAAPAVRPAPAGGKAVGAGNAQGKAPAAKTGNAQAEKPTTRLLTTTEAAKVMKEAGAPAIAYAQQGWDLRRKLEARRKVKAKDVDGYYARPWAELPETAKAMWVASETHSTTDYRLVKQEMQRVRAADEADKVAKDAKREVDKAKRQLARELEAERISAEVLRHYKMSSGEARTKLGRQILVDYTRHMNEVAENQAERKEARQAKREAKKAGTPVEVVPTQRATPLPDDQVDVGSLTIRDVQEALFGDISEHVRGASTNANPFVEGKRRPIVDALAEASEMENGVDFLLQMIDEARMTIHPELQGIAKLFRNIGVSGIRIEFIDEKRVSESGFPKLGNYNSTTNTIEIYRGGTSAPTILHEVAHALTVHSMAEAARAKQAGKTSEKTKAFDALSALAEYAKAHGVEQGSKDVYEFVAETMSNPDMQRQLRALDAPAQAKLGKPWYKTVYDGFVEGVRTLLGLNPKARTALDAAIELSSRFLAPNTKDAPLVDNEGGMYDATATPAAALNLPYAAAGRYIGSAERWAARAATSTNEKLRKAANYLSSTKHIMRRVLNDVALKPMKRGFDMYFKADQNKTAVMKLVGDESYGYARSVELLAAKTKNPLKTIETLGWMFSEADRLNIDLRRNYAQNFAANTLINPILKTEVDALHAEYVRFGRQPHGKELLKLGHDGVRLNRKTYAMQTAAFSISILNGHRAAGQDQQAANAALLKFAPKLDLLQETAGMKNTDPETFRDGFAAHLHKTLTELFAHVATHAPNTELAQDIKLAQEFYEAAWARPYMHLGRHGMYTVEFDAIDTSPATVAKLDKLLGKYGKAMGQFLGDSSHVFMRVDTLFEANEIFHLMKGQQALIKTKDGQSTLRAGAISEAASLDSAFGVSKAMRALRTRMHDKYEDLGKGKTPEVKAAFDAAIHALNATLIDMLDVDSARKASAKRMGVPGYETNFLRNFTKRAQWATSAISNQYVADTFSDGFREMKTTIDELKAVDPIQSARGQELYDELAMRHANALNPVDSPVIDKVRALGYNFYLALSPAFFITNLMQPYHLTLPLLGARFGFVKTAKEMGRAAATSFSILKTTTKRGWSEGGARGVLDATLDFTKSVPNALERKFVEHVLRAGVVDATASHELGRLAEGESSTAATIAKTASLFSHYSEIHNRLTAGIAAFRLSSGTFRNAAVAAANDQKVPAGERAAFIAEEEFRLRTAYAVEAIEKTQFNYSDHNTARALGRHGFAGKVTPLLTAFQQYAFQTMEHYIRLASESVLREPGASAARQKEIEAIRKEARLALSGTLVTTSLIAGTMGLPFATVLAALANAADDDDKDVREKYRAWLAGVFGKDMAEIIAKGATRTLGIDMSARAGHQDLIPGSRFLADRRHWEDKLKDQNKTLLGPALNAGMDIATGLSHVANGDVIKGIESTLPLAIRGLYKSAVVANTGGYTNKAGNQIPLELNSWDLAVQAAAFTPAKKAEQAEASFYHQSEVSRIKSTKTELRNQLVRALENGEDTSEIMQQVQQFNAEHPGDPVTGVQESLRTRAQARAAAQASGTGILEANRKYFPSISSRAGWANTGIGEQ